MTDRDHLPAERGLGTHEHSGTTVGYLPEYFGEDKEWHRIPIMTIKDAAIGEVLGAPHPNFSREVLMANALYGYEQALSLMWQWAAYQQASKFHFTTPRCRITEYSIKYSFVSTFTQIKTEVKDDE